MNDALMDFLELLLCFNLHITITSAKRSIAENKAAGGVPRSQHLFGEAIDIKPYGSTIECELCVYRQEKENSRG
jgi:uncharacterized protein YcbK (DUF882 family)